MSSSQERSHVLGIAGSNSPPTFYPEEGVLHKMPDFIKITVIVTLLFSVFLGRDYNIHSRSNGVRNDF